MAEIVLTEATTGGTSAAAIGDVLVVQLTETPTTGFRWALAAVDRNVLEPMGDEFQLGARSGVGGGGMRMFRFMAKGRGSTVLEIKLARAWEFGLRKTVFTVQVRVS